jgi:DNA topoisomerase VI subunit B
MILLLPNKIKMKGKSIPTPPTPPTPTPEPTRQEKLQSFLQGVEQKVAGMLESDVLAISKKKVQPPPRSCPTCRRKSRFLTWLRVG